MQLVCGSHQLDLSTPRVMGVLNVTPDSFSDGGSFISAPVARAHARQMAAEGAAIIDVGGESTRPGAAAVSAQEELDRVIPVIEAIRGEIDLPISIDTSKPAVMREAVAAGASMINDVLALQAPEALATAAELAVPVCLMHMQGTPRTMQENPRYDDVVAEVRDFLLARADAAMAAGIERSRILLDPGFGFGKSIAHNCRLLMQLHALAEPGFPLLVGMSRKRMIGELTGKPVEDRVFGGIAAHLRAVAAGASLIRAHDVGATVDAINAWIGIDRYGR